MSAKRVVLEEMLCSRINPDYVTVQSESEWLEQEDPTGGYFLSTNFTLPPVNCVGYGDVGELLWASTLVKEGARLPPPDICPQPLPFLVTEPTRFMDGVIEDMVENAILVEDTSIRAAFPLFLLTTERFTVQVCQDFSAWALTNTKNNNTEFYKSFNDIQRIAPLDEMIKIRLTDGYLQLKVHEDSRKYCGVLYGERRFAMTRLPPQHIRAPYIMQRWAEVVGHLLEAKFDVYTVTYVEEWLVHGVNLPVEEILVYLRIDLGVGVDVDTSVLEPTTSIQFHGMVVESARQCVTLTPHAQRQIQLYVANVPTVNYGDRERIARFWSWVAFCYRLPLFLEEDIVSGKTKMLSLFLTQLNLSEARKIKRARKVIALYTDARDKSVAAYCPEYRLGFAQLVSKSMSADGRQLTAAIDGPRWALKEVVPDCVDLDVYLASPVSYCACVKGSCHLFHSDDGDVWRRKYVALFTRTRSSVVTWYSEFITRARIDRPTDAVFDKLHDQATSTSSTIKILRQSF